VAPFIQLLNRGLSDKSVSRDRAEVARFFRGLELVEPGVVNISEWRPLRSTNAEPAILWGAVARKPRLPQGDPADRGFLGAGGDEPSGGIVERPLAGTAPACVHGLRCPCQSQSPARNGWWNHTAWSTKAARCVPGSPTWPSAAARSAPRWPARAMPSYCQRRSAARVTAASSSALNRKWSGFSPRPTLVLASVLCGLVAGQLAHWAEVPAHRHRDPGR
ncbi:MAG TPA: SAM-dependent methyltransferase, partial [Streptosporangiaceae bacterium]